MYEITFFAAREWKDIDDLNHTSHDGAKDKQQIGPALKIEHKPS